MKNFYLTAISEMTLKNCVKNKQKSAVLFNSSPV